MMHFIPVIDFWFKEITPAQWWQKNRAFDDLIRKRFLTIHQKATRGELHEWRREPLGRLAEIIVLDQFSRNIYRDQAQAFAYDKLALNLAQQAINNGSVRQLNVKQRAFVYMPFMHSESLTVQEIALQLFSEPGLEDNLHAAQRHKAIIDQFGRFPHRNKILDRPSTPTEMEFLQQPGSSF